MTAPEFRNGPVADPGMDQWVLLLSYLPLALRDAEDALRDPGLLDLMRDRFEWGRREYGDAWLGRDDGWFTREAAEEAADLVLYNMMRRARAHHPDQLPAEARPPSPR